MQNPCSPYRGRVAPSPTGLLHLGHASTFWTAFQRAQSARGTLVFRSDDLDPLRSQKKFETAAIEDLLWLGIHWQEGPDHPGPFGPYCQSLRLPLYAQAFEQLRAQGFLYPCSCSRREVALALSAPHQTDPSEHYPGTCRPPEPRSAFPLANSPVNWRFRIPDSSPPLTFLDRAQGPQSATPGRDFGDFLVWRKDGLPSYQLATVVDDHRMKITEVVRGADLIPSTFQQILLYRALGWPSPAFFHCPLLCDPSGARLAKRSDSLSIQTLRLQHPSPESIRALFQSKACNAARAPGSTPPSPAP